MAEARYTYEAYRDRLFTDEGSQMFTKIRDNTLRLIDLAGAVMSGNATRRVTGDTFDMMACLDRMIEMDDIEEVTEPHVRGQDRVFVKAGV